MSVGWCPFPGQGYIVTSILLLFVFFATRMVCGLFHVTRLKRCPLADLPGMYIDVSADFHLLPFPPSNLARTSFTPNSNEGIAGAGYCESNLWPNQINQVWYSHESSRNGLLVDYTPSYHQGSSHILYLDVFLLCTSLCIL